MKKYNVAVVGASGMVGQSFLSILAERKFPIDNFYAFTSVKSAGKKVLFNDKEYAYEELTENSFDSQIDIAFFCVDGNESKKFSPIAAGKGCVVIDNSSYFRMDKDVPLVVPEVNPQDIQKHKGIIANPNCSTTQAMVALKPLSDKYGLKRVVYSTYQAVSGAGVGGVTDLNEGLKGEAPKLFPHPIASNCIPQIDVFTESGYTKEEIKMIEESRKILGLPELPITATTVRVPVINGHSESINIELNNPFELADIIDIYKNTEGVVVQNDGENGVYPMAYIASGTDPVYIGRIRRDFSVQNGLNIWVVADNIRKGAALNAVQIAETMIKEHI